MPYFRKELKNMIIEYRYKSLQLSNIAKNFLFMLSPFSPSWQKWIKLQKTAKVGK
jgi:hypothetical protein